MTPDMLTVDFAFGLTVLSVILYVMYKKGSFK